MLSTVLAACSLAVLPAVPATAAPPEEYDVSGVIPAGRVCAFPLAYELSGKSKVLERDGYLLITGPRNVARLTNARTGESVTLRIGGIFKDRAVEGGTRTVATGRNVVLGPDGAVLLVGRVTFTLDDELSVVEDYSGPGRVVDLCARLS